MSRSGESPTNLNPYRTVRNSSRCTRDFAVESSHRISHINYSFIRSMISNTDTFICNVTILQTKQRSHELWKDGALVIGTIADDRTTRS